MRARLSIVTALAWTISACAPLRSMVANASAMSAPLPIPATISDMPSWRDAVRSCSISSAFPWSRGPGALAPNSSTATRVAEGRSSRRSCSRFVAVSVDTMLNPVTLPPGRA